MRKHTTKETKPIKSTTETRKIEEQQEGPTQEITERQNPKDLAVHILNDVKVAVRDLKDAAAIIERKMNLALECTEKFWIKFNSEEELTRKTSYIV